MALVPLLAAAWLRLHTYYGRARRALPPSVARTFEFLYVILLDLDSAGAAPSSADPAPAFRAARMKALRKSLSSLNDATQEQRSRVQEAVQLALRDGSLEVEFKIKEKNRRILELEEEKRNLKQECASRDPRSAYCINDWKMKPQHCTPCKMAHESRLRRCCSSVRRCSRS